MLLKQHKEFRKYTKQFYHISTSLRRVALAPTTTHTPELLLRILKNATSMTAKGVTYKVPTL